MKNSFLWGAATSSYQVEGHCDNNDWNMWEKSLKNDNTPCINNNDKAGICTDHWNRYQEDILLLKKLGANTYRFSIEWSKVEPEPNVWNENSINHYVDVCRFLNKNKMIPLVTLHHFTNPIWLYNKDGFETSYGVKRFLIFVEKIVTALAPYVTFWCTINEPMIYARMGWLHSPFPPGKSNLHLASTVYKNILCAHAASYHLIHKIYQKTQPSSHPQVGLAKALIIVDPVNPDNSNDSAAAENINHYHNLSFFNAINSGKLVLRDLNTPLIDENIEGLKHSLNWIGVNYYTREMIKYDSNNFLHFTSVPELNKPRTDMGWVIYPEGMYRAIKMASVLNKPIYITENGLATDDENLRKDYTTDHINQMLKAIDDGYDVQGYYHWSLLDNFEWAHGFRPHFGLYSVNLDTLERKLKPGAELYRQIISKFSIK